MHIVTNVEGALRPGLSTVDVLSSLLPAGTLSGAPKVRAMEIIDELEPLRRGVYGGAVGYLGFDGNMDTCIAIRSAVIRKGKIHVQAGAGIVADSVPETEYLEKHEQGRRTLFGARKRGRHEMILLLDNFDSFNLQRLPAGRRRESRYPCRPQQCDHFDEIEELKPSHIIVSPGPGFPASAGISIGAIKAFAGEDPDPRHLFGAPGDLRSIWWNGRPRARTGSRQAKGPCSLLKRLRGEMFCPLFERLPDTIGVARYHSLAADPATTPDCLLVTATAPDETVMGIMHREYPVFGVQFHPESILTDTGSVIMENFFKNLKHFANEYILHVTSESFL